MRLDNYIYDHQMLLPDIASFPECEGERFPDDVDTGPLDAAFDASFEQLDINKFCEALTLLNQEMLQRVPLDAEACEHRNAQNSRIVSATEIFMRSTREQTPRNDIPRNAVYNALHEQGYFSVSVDTRPLVNLLAREIDELLNREDNNAAPHFYDRAFQFREENNQRLFDILRGMFSALGVFKGATKYNQNGDIDLDMVALHVASPTDTHHYQTFRDCHTTTKLISLHADPKFNLIKSLMYLNDVDDEAGPFSYVPESSRWWFDEVERLFAYGNSTGNYLDSPAARRAALAAPVRYRKNAIAGRLIPDDTPLSDMLLAKLHPFTSSEANCVVFDPLGFHRGGLCVSKRRVALQILMRPKG